MKLFGIIGYPLGHSFSERYFTHKFKVENLSGCQYRKFEISSLEMLPELLEREQDFIGFNVTIPYKIQIISYLDEIDAAAAEIGAVNTVRVTRRNGTVHLKGFNTDAPAFRQSLLDSLSSLPESAVVLGTGGASRSVCHVLLELGIRVIPVSRKPAAGIFTYHDLPGEVLSSAGLVVNTTPVGTSPDTEASPPIDYSWLREGQMLFDLIYNPPQTRFLRLGEEQGCQTVNGEGMFHIQAEMAWEIWNRDSK
ncbi:MAG TPA: shikimate dehydrogenase [Bacteroidales bacterium]|nr:shikimate dehydrogenase [Bacteroidales bacterium]